MKLCSLFEASRTNPLVLPDPANILQQWMRHFQALLDDRSHRIDPAMLELVWQFPLCRRLDEDLKAEELLRALKQMANDKAMGRKELPAELLKHAIGGDRKIVTGSFWPYAGSRGCHSVERRNLRPARKERHSRVGQLPGDLAMIMAHAGKVLLKIVSRCRVSYIKEKVVPGAQ